MLVHPVDVTGSCNSVHLVAPQSVLVVGGEGVDDDRDGEGQDEDAAEGAQAACNRNKILLKTSGEISHQFLGTLVRIIWSHLEFNISFKVPL